MPAYSPGRVKFSNAQEESIFYLSEKLSDEKGQNEGIMLTIYLFRSDT